MYVSCIPEHPRDTFYALWTSLSSSGQSFKFRPLLGRFWIDRRNNLPLEFDSIGITSRCIGSKVPTKHALCGLEKSWGCHLAVKIPSTFLGFPHLYEKLWQNLNLCLNGFQFTSLTFCGTHSTQIGLNLKMTCLFLCCGHLTAGFWHPSLIFRPECCSLPELNHWFNSFRPAGTGTWEQTKMANPVG